MEKLIITGILGMDAEVKEHNGKQFVTLQLKISKDKHNTVWYNVSGDFVGMAQYLKKGAIVSFSGTPNFRPYYNGYYDGIRADLYARSVDIIRFAPKKNKDLTSNVIIQAGHDVNDESDDLPF